MDISHEVFNQPEPMVNDSLHKSRWPLQDTLKFNAHSLNIAALTQPSTRVGLAEMPAHACDQVLDVHVRQRRLRRRCRPQCFFKVPKCGS